MNYVALTTDSWKAYEEYRKGHEAFDQYNFLGALGYYEKALKLDPTLALAYAEQSYVYFMTGQTDQATKSIEAAKQQLPQASPMEQLAIRVLDYGWDAERNEYTIQELINIAPSGVWDEVLIHRLTANIYKQEGKQMEAVQHDQQWFEAAQRRIRANPENIALLHSAATRCYYINRYVDEAISMELKVVASNMAEPADNGPRHILSLLYERKGDMEQALEWAKRSVQKMPDPRYAQNIYHRQAYDHCWLYLWRWLNNGEVPPERLLRWCEDVLGIPGLHLPSRLHAQYLTAGIYEFMNDSAKADSILASLGAPRESDWIVIGAFDAPMEPFPDTAPFELLNDLTATHTGMLGKEIQWEQWEDKQPMDGVIRISDIYQRRYYGQRNVSANDRGSCVFGAYSVAYSCIYIEVPTAMEVQMRTGVGKSRIWLNDNPAPIFQGDSVWVAVPDIEVNTIALKAGLNRFLVATSFGACAFDFTFRITDKEGNAIPGLKYISAKEVLASR